MTLPSRAVWRHYLGAAVLVAGIVAGQSVSAQEPAACLSPNPSDWPAPAKPYFMLVVDTSGSMTACTTPPTNYPTTCNQNAPGYALNSCGMVPTRINDAKCAFRKTVQAFDGQVNFGLAGFALGLTGCGANAGTCVSDCGTTGGSCGSDNYQCNWLSPPDTTSSCGNRPGCNGANPGSPNLLFGNVGGNSRRNGARILVGLQQDAWWSGGPPPATNAPAILGWMDGNCNNNQEITAGGGTPTADAMYAVSQYLRGGWSQWTGDSNNQSAGNYCNGFAPTWPSPFNNQDRECRSVNIILMTDGDPSFCDYGSSANANAAAAATAADLFNNGITIGGKNWPVRTHVINFAGGNINFSNAIANAGGTNTSLSANNEATLAQGLANIISSAIPPETCDNADNNCNGCTDEGYPHYCNVQPTASNCCAWNNATQRQTCLTNYANSISGANPEGNKNLLPCTTPTQQTQPANWLCIDPGERCDNVDNNCSGGTDEGVTRCGNPLHCPIPETCNGEDDDCDGQVDEGNVCAGCTPSPEVCDGCDNDCDGVVDNGTFPGIACGQPSPNNCSGTISCGAPQAAPFVGGCVANAGYGTCSANPQPDNNCDGIDNDCDGVPDDDYVPAPCVPPGHANGLSYGAPSQCMMGTSSCVNGTVVCQGGVGPSNNEPCDGVDNDCNGQVDDNAVGVGMSCGINTAPCSPGTLACVNGALVCQGEVGPQPEVCDGIDNNCNGKTDEGPLTDAPAANANGCWQEAGNCCSHGGLNWCPPAGATCNDNGTLTNPCNRGTLACVAGAWTCQNANGPSPEVCDGVDNDCDGNADDGTLPQVGNPCGTDTGECQQGTLSCTAGVLSCDGSTGPAMEICDGLDNDCDGQTDEDLGAGDPCTAPYDTTQYPGDRTKGLCKPGVLKCDGQGGSTCDGSVGPQPEVCDGLDNDCDGLVDETGPAPDGIDGSANPNAPPAANIGDACGTDVGECEQGAWACNNGIFACLGGKAPAPEVCDCLDNDCDGTNDNMNGANGPPICGSGQNCVESAGACQCAAPCGAGEFPCAGGLTCETVKDSSTGNELPEKHCIAKEEDVCGDCAKKTVKGANDMVVCAPAGTDPANCNTTPVCECKGSDGCREPCHNVQCGQNEVCSNFGPNAGKCVQNTCFLTGCAGCDKVCNLGSCVDSPCKADSCQAGETCKPNDTFTDFVCEKSCAGVTCKDDERCEKGQCVDACDPVCKDGEICDPSNDTCVANKCVDAMGNTTMCSNGGCCDPLTGTCGNCPCEGVVCADGESCDPANGQCTMGSGGAAGSAGAAGDAGSAGSAATAGSAGTSGTGGGAGSDSGTGGSIRSAADKKWGLATGGGGCACEVGASKKSQTTYFAMALAAVAMGVLRRRRQTRKEVA